MTEEISQKPAPFRPIAPSMPKILPLATSINMTDYKKRKWDEILDDSKGMFIYIPLSIVLNLFHFKRNH